MGERRAGGNLVLVSHGSILLVLIFVGLIVMALLSLMFKYLRPSALTIGLVSAAEGIAAWQTARWLHRRYMWLWVYLAHAALLGLVCLGVGWLAAETTAEMLRLSASLFLWTVVVRTVYVWHITWFVNSAAHRWGYQNYDTGDRSRNNWWVALLTNGEGWHNNHHATPRAASHGHRWWEVDLTYTFIRFLELVGLAKQVVPVKVPSAATGRTRASPCACPAA